MQLGALFVGSLALTVWEVTIFERTFIPFKFPLLIWFLTGLLFTPIMKKTQAFNFTSGNIILQIVYNLVTWGGIAVSIFILSNYYFAENATIVINESIISTGHLGSGSRGHCAKPFIIINHNG